MVRRQEPGTVDQTKPPWICLDTNFAGGSMQCIRILLHADIIALCFYLVMVNWGGIIDKHFVNTRSIKQWKNIRWCVPGGPLSCRMYINRYIEAWHKSMVYKSIVWSISAALSSWWRLLSLHCFYSKGMGKVAGMEAYCVDTSLHLQSQYALVWSGAQSRELQPTSNRPNGERERARTSITGICVKLKAYLAWYGSSHKKWIKSARSS